MQPVVRLVDIGETWIKVFAKYMLTVAGLEATHSCKYEQLSLGWNAEIDGAVHRVQSI